MLINRLIRIREEENFHLLTNLDPESIIKGKPSFFQLNDDGKAAIELLQAQDDSTEEELISTLITELNASESYSREFIGFLTKADILR